MQICFASNNKNKLAEIRLMLGPDFLLLSLDDIGYHHELAEDQSTLEGNAQQKARFIYNNFNLPCFADDSGLEVAALGSAPGVYSARYAGQQRNNDDNIALLLKNLTGVADRRAQFRTVIALEGFNAPKLFEGIIQGTIISEKRGSEGFGYDPVFVPDGHQKTFAEMTLEEKNTISHRAIAVSKLVAYLKNLSNH